VPQLKVARMTANSSNQPNATTTRNQSGQFAPSDEQRAKEEELAKQRNSKERLARCKTLFAQHLANAQSALATEIFAGNYYMSVAECNAYKRERSAPVEVADVDVDDTPYIRTQVDADVYFKDVGLNATRNFKVVVETPTQT
jgi:hypothetical protein